MVRFRKVIDLLPAESARRSVEEAKDFASDVLLTGLLVVHNALVGGQDDGTELSGGKNGVSEVLELVEREVEARGDDTALVEATVQVHDDFASAGIIDDLEISDVAVLLHDLEELDEDLGDGSQDNLQDTYINITVALVWSELLPLQCLSGPKRGQR